MPDQPWVEQATGRVADLTDLSTGTSFGKTFRAVARINGSEAKFKRFALASSVDELVDLNAELTFALLFIGLGFEVAFEPTGKKGPDLSISRDGHSAYVEVKRFRQRKDAGTESTAATSNLLIFQEYGQPEKDTDKVRSELCKKFRQVAGHNGIVAMWCDDDDLEDLEHEFAVDDIRRDSESSVQRVPEDVLFSIFAGAAQSCATGQQVYCRAFRRLTDPFRAWAEELEQISVKACLRYAMTKLTQAQ